MAEETLYQNKWNLQLVFSSIESRLNIVWKSAVYSFNIHLEKSQFDALQQIVGQRKKQEQAKNRQSTTQKQMKHAHMPKMGHHQN